MNLNSKQATTGVTILIMLAILFVINYLVGGVGVGNFRVDLTEDKLYTLSDGTRNILNRVNPDKPVTIRYYVSTDDRVMPPILKTYARTIQDLLLEFEKAADGRLVLEKLNPNPNTEDEDKAREDDIQGMQVNSEGDNIYLGLAIQSAEKKELLPFMNPNEETALEYNIARAIAKVTKTTQTVVGVMSALPVQGTPQMPFMQQPGQQQQQPWMIIQRLRMDYEVREIAPNSDKIDSDVNVLVVIHPATLPEQAEYAIDQYVLKGGQVIAFVDPQCWIAQVYSNQGGNPMMGGGQNMISPSSELKALFKTWGVGFGNDQVVADMSYLSMMQGRRNPTALSLPAAAINKGDRVTAELQSMTMVGAGSFNIEKTDGIVATPLIESSENSEMIDTAAAEKLRTEAMTSFNPSGRKKVLGVRLTGKFKTAFPNGKPQGPPAPGKEAGGAQDDATAPKTEAAAPAAPATPAPTAPATPAAAPAPAVPETKPVAPAPTTATTPPVSVTTPPVSVTTTPVSVPSPVAPPAPATPNAAPTADAAKAPEAKDDGSLKVSEKDGVVLLFSDVDMLFDAFAVQRDPMTGGVIPLNSNMPMFLNAVEIASGGGDLLSVRSRASTQRPFTKLDEMRDKVERQFRPRLETLQAKLQETAQKISTLRLKKDAKSQMLILDPTQVKDLEAMQEAQASINKEIREVKKEQNKEIDRTENILTLANVFAMPLLVISIGILLALRRKAITAAR